MFQQLHSINDFSILPFKPASYVEYARGYSFSPLSLKAFGVKKMFLVCDERSTRIVLKTPLQQIDYRFERIETLPVFAGSVLLSRNQGTSYKSREFKFGWIKVLSTDFPYTLMSDSLTDKQISLMTDIAFQDRFEKVTIVFAQYAEFLNMTAQQEIISSFLKRCSSQ